MSIVISLIITVIVGIATNYIFLPALTLSSPGFWMFLIALVATFFVSILCFSYLNWENDFINQVAMGSGTAAGILFVLFLILGIAGSPMFRANTYANVMQIEEADESMIPTVDNLSQIPLMDTDSAKKLGDRTVGSLTDVVSQYVISADYTTITYNNRVYKIAPLQYAGFFKYNSNKYNGIPGYVLVDTESNTAEYVALDKGFRISDSAFFGNDLLRTLRNQYPSLIFSSYNFQIDEDGNPYWIACVVEPRAIFGSQAPVGAVIMDACTGSSNYYALNEVPEWVDYVLDGTEVSKYYNWHGDYQNGFWNALLSQKDVTHTTDDFGYISKDNDIWIYTGVTSVMTDESNLGFIMVNSRTGQCYYIPCDGAEEYSAMNAAEGVVQNYGYAASFPALITIENEPTYALVLKDANGLIKQYAFVNVKNYTLVAIGSTLEKAHGQYLRVLNGEDITEDAVNAEDSPSSTEAFVPEVTITEDNGVVITVVVDRVEYYILNGNTYVYLFSGKKVYKQPLSQNENIVFVQPGDTVELLAVDTDNSIVDAVLKDIKTSFLEN